MRPAVVGPFPLPLFVPLRPAFASRRVPSAFAASTKFQLKRCRTSAELDLTFRFSLRERPAAEVAGARKNSNPPRIGKTRSRSAARNESRLASPRIDRSQPDDRRFRGRRRRVRSRRRPHCARRCVYVAEECHPFEKYKNHPSELLTNRRKVQFYGPQACPLQDRGKNGIFPLGRAETNKRTARGRSERPIPRGAYASSPP